MDIRDMRVYLGGRNIRMAEHLLNRADVGAILDHVGGKRMPQGVGRNAFETTFFGVFTDENVDNLPVYRPAEGRDK